MALVLTRKVGEAVLVRRPGEDGVMRTMRLYVVAVEGNVVRLAFDGPRELEVVREELTAE